jgi:hypothetical protein
VGKIQKIEEIYILNCKKYLKFINVIKILLEKVRTWATGDYKIKAGPAVGII